MVSSRRARQMLVLVVAVVNFQLPLTFTSISSTALQATVLCDRVSRQRPPVSSREVRYASDVQKVKVKQKR